MTNEQLDRFQKMVRKSMRDSDDAKEHDTTQYFAGRADALMYVDNLLTDLRNDLDEHEKNMTLRKENKM